MRIRYFIQIILFITLLNTKAYSGPAYDNNLNIRKAHQLLFALRPLSAEKLLKSEEIKNPDNGYIIFYRMYSEVISLMIANSSEQYTKRSAFLNQYVEGLRKLPDNSPDYRLLLGEAKVFTGLIRVKYDSKFSGLIECLRGYNLLQENAEKYPLYEPDDKIPGMIQVSVAFMPKIIQWGIKLLGIKGNPQAGLKKLSDYAKFAQGKPGYDEESFVFTMAAYKIMNQEDELMKLIIEKKEQFKEIALINYIAATVASDANRGDYTLQLISNIQSEKLEIPFPQIHYISGKTKMMRLDPDADIPLLTYLKESTATDYLKTTLYEVACYYLVTGNIPQYRNYINQVKEQGRELHNRDIEAAFEAIKSELPNRWLMRAEYLVRGGYEQKADEELAKITDLKTLNEAEIVQYYYLKGESKRLKRLVAEAETAYLKAFDTGKSSGDYYAQKALVQAGIMLENNGSRAEAGKYYNLVLKFSAKSNPYSDLYTNKAKAGLIRLSFVQ